MGEFLAVRDVGELRNDELSMRVRDIQTKLLSIQDSTKDVAMIVGEIMENELYADDFETITDFAKYMNCSRARLTQFRRFHNIINMVDNSIYEDFSYSQLVEMIPAIEKMLALECNDNAICKWIRDNIVPVMSCRQIRDIVTNYKAYGEEGDADIEDVVDVEDAGGNEESVNMPEPKSEDDESEDFKKFAVSYMGGFEEGMELDKSDIQVIKQIIKFLSK